jgi:hypothetical protein
MGMNTSPTIVDFPLRGEWVAAQTPAERVPSHGTDVLGERYAYDFMRIEGGSTGWKFFRGSKLRYYLVGVRLEDCYGWGAPIYAPFGGTVVAAKDGWAERKRVFPLTDLAVALKNGLTFDRKKTVDLTPLAGNHIVLKMRDKEVYASFAHARCGSIRVRQGDEVRTGQHLADVGHSGNSTAPHLHFQLMERADALQARGLPCSFRKYEALRNGEWAEVSEGMPRRREFIRCGT